MLNRAEPKSPQAVFGGGGTPHVLGGRHPPFHCPRCGHRSHMGEASV